MYLGSVAVNAGTFDGGRVGLEWLNRVNYIFTACFMSPLLQALSSGQLLQHVLHFLFHSIVYLLLPSPDQPQPSSNRSEAGLSHYKGQVRCDKVSANGANYVPKTSEFQSGQKAAKKMLHILYSVYLWHTRWLNAKNHQKHSKNQYSWLHYLSGSEITMPKVRLGNCVSFNFFNGYVPYQSSCLEGLEYVWYSRRGIGSP